MNLNIPISSNMYNQYDYNINGTLLMGNKLFCTFTYLDDLDTLTSSLIKKYNILYNKMFVLQIKDHNEYVVTYNVEQGNISDIPDNTILVHRKKHTNSLYTINALNELIKSLNEGKLNPSFEINWEDYRNCILLTQHQEIKKLNTQIFKIINL